MEKMEKTHEEDMGTLTFGQALKAASEYTREEAAHMNTRKDISGMVVWCDRHEKRCMLTCREKGVLRKVFSGTLPVRLSRKLFAGDIVSFRFGYDEESVYAEEIQKTGHVSVPNAGIPLDKDVFVGNRTVLRYGFRNAANGIYRKQGMKIDDLKKALSENGYALSDLSYIYIRTPNDMFRVFPRTSPIKGDLQVDDLEDFLAGLDRLVLGIREDDNSFLTKEQAEERQRREREEGEQRAAENLKKSLYITGFCGLVAAEIYALGFSEKEARALVKRQGLEKLLKRAMVTFDDPEKAAKDLAEKYTRNKRPEKARFGQVKEDCARKADALRARAKLQMEGHTKKEAKDILQGT